MTTTDETTATAVALPPDHLACLACGVAVPRTPGSEVLEVESWRRAGLPVELPRPVTLEMLRCPSCAEILALANALLDCHPKAIAAIGSRIVALHRVESSLDALAVIGRPMPPLSVSDAELGSVIRHLVAPGVAARWLARFSPVLAADAAQDTCAPTPWAHVSDEIRSAVRDGAGAVMAEQVARSSQPVQLPPPSSAVQDAPGVLVRDGCLLCGIGTQSMAAIEVQRAGGPRNAARQVWTASTWSPGSLGAQSSPENITGHLCRDCAHAVDEAGSQGPAAMEMSLVAHLAPEAMARLHLGTMSMSGVVAWGAVKGRAPNTSRWGHVVGLDGLRDRLSALV